MIRFCICLIGSILINYTIEVYPVKVRNLIFGLSLVAGGLGSIAMPILIILLLEYDLSPFIIFGILSVITLYLMRSLP
jgi:hypothetical protein